jgi:iron complex transport system substrate-binding protein
MRIVTLMPAGTEIVHALGLGRKLVGISHDSDWPAEAAGHPVVTRPVDPPSLEAGAGASTDAGPTTATAGTDPLARRVVIDEAALAALRPDLVIGPAVREVAAPVAGGLRQAIDALGEDVELLVLDPASVEGILHSISTVGAMTGAEAAGLRLVERLRGRLGRLERRVQRRRDQGRRPVRVVALESIDPPLAAGRWIPEQVRRAGGWELLGREAEPASPTTWRAVCDVDPESVVLMPRGQHLDAAVAAWSATPRPPEWDRIEAVRRGQVFAADAAAYFGGGPRFVEGIALLAEILDPDGFVEMSPIGSWTPVD